MSRNTTRLFLGIWKNLLQQTKHHKFMLIADTAGMGKTTVLAQLSKRIKKMFPF